MNSWGQYPKLSQTENILTSTIHELPENHFLAQGLARSYGDSCLSNSGNLLVTKKLDSLISFENGLLECEPGVSVHQLNNILVDRGWFIPVTPGTQFVTLAGAIANDIHGKNHHSAGTLGNFVKELELVTSSGTKIINPNDELFNATIAGLGLTGFINRLKIQLKAIPSRYIETEILPFKNLEEFFTISESSKNHEYTVAWIDCVATGDNFARGIFFRGNHTEQTGRKKKSLNLGVPFNFPAFALNKYSVKAFNILYYNMMSRKGEFLQDLIPFFYPLDSVQNWNRIYGKQGFLQFQCVIPKNEELVRKLLTMITNSGKASFLAVFKEFGSVKSPGILSFPREGITLALDFPADKKGIKLVQKLNDFVCENSGALYPAKDALMTKEHFEISYKDHEIFRKFIDPKIDSSFAKRVGLI